MEGDIQFCEHPFYPPRYAMEIRLPDTIEGSLAMRTARGVRHSKSMPQATNVNIIRELMDALVAMSPGEEIKLRVERTI